eukprot:gene7828-1027_t
MRTGTTKGLYTRQLVQTSDGGTLGMDWWDGSDKWNYGDATTPVLLVIHGINGGSHEGYCKWACRAAASKGWRAVTLNMRGCNGLPLSTNRGYAATLTPDISLAVQTVKARFPQASVTAAGYSLGAIALTKYLAEVDRGLHGVQGSGLIAAAAVSSPGAIALTKYLAEADRGLHGVQGSGLIAAAAVSSPVCLFNSSFNISQPWTIAYIYNLAVAFKLREYVKHHRVDIANASTFDIDSALQTRTVAEFEDSGVPKQFGYDSRQESLTISFENTNVSKQFGYDSQQEVRHMVFHFLTCPTMPSSARRALHCPARPGTPDALRTLTVAEFENTGVPKQFGSNSLQEGPSPARPGKPSALHTHTVAVFENTGVPKQFGSNSQQEGVLPDLECSKNPSTLLVATPHGGHVAFVQGMWPLGHAYMDDAVMEFFLVMERETRAQGSALRSTHSSCSSSAQSEATASDEDSMRASFSTDASSHSIVGQQRAPCSATSTSGSFVGQQGAPCSTDASSHSIVGQQRAPCSATSSSHSIVGQQRASCSASTTSSSFVGQQSSLQQGSRSYVRGAATRYCDSVGEQGSLQESSRSYGSGAATSSYERVGQKNSLQKGSQSFDRGLSDNPGSHNNADQHIRSLQQGSHSYGRGRSDAAGSHKIPDQHSRSLQQSSRSHGSGTPGSQASEETGALQEAVHDTGPVEDSGTPGSQASEETGALQEAVHDTGAVKDSGTPGSQASEETGAQQEAVHDTGAVEDPKAAACGTLNEVPSGSQGLHLQPAAATLKLRSGRASPALGLTAKKCGTQETQALSTALRRAPYFPKVQSKL